MTQFLITTMNENNSQAKASILYLLLSVLMRCEKYPFLIIFTNSKTKHSSLCLGVFARE